jgi:hypothetical protein
MLAGAVVIGGGMIVTLGARLTWATVSIRRSPVAAPGLPPAAISSGSHAIAGSELGVGYLFGLGLLLALVPLGWLVTGPRGRRVLGVLGLAVALGIGVGVAVGRADVADRALRVSRVGGPQAGAVESGPGIGVTAAGAALGALGSIAGAVTGGSIPRMRLPERDA